MESTVPPAVTIGPSRSSHVDSPPLRASLAGLARGQVATVVEVGGEGPFRRRLLELGLVPGTRVSRTGQAPLGDPLSFRVRHAVVSLRRRDAALIVVEPIG